MVYESDFYTTRRPYSSSSSRPYVSSYSVTGQPSAPSSVPWDKVPLVPRPSQVAEPFTVWGRKRQDPKKEFYQYVTLKEKDGVVRGKNPAKDDHTRQLIEGGAISRVGLDAAGELAQRGHVYEKGILARKPGAQRHAHTPASGRTKILMALQTPSWYRF